MCAFVHGCHMWSEAISEVLGHDRWKVKVIDGSLTLILPRMLPDMVDLCYGWNICAAPKFLCDDNWRWVFGK